MEFCWGGGKEKGKGIIPGSYMACTRATNNYCSLWQVWVADGTSGVKLVHSLTCPAPVSLGWECLPLPPKPGLNINAGPGAVFPCTCFPETPKMLLYLWSDQKEKGKKEEKRKFCWNCPIQPNPETGNNSDVYGLTGILIWFYSSLTPLKSADFLLQWCKKEKSITPCVFS